MQTIHTLSYCQRRGELKTYFDRTATEAWKQLTSEAPVSKIRMTVRAGRNEMRKTLVDWLPADLRGKRILDAGCGTGSLAIEAARRGAHVVAIDIAASLVELARTRTAAELADLRSRHGDGDIEFYVGDMLDPALGTFDHIIAMDSLIHYRPADAVNVLARLTQAARTSIAFTFAPRTRMLATMHTVGRWFPSSNRAPSIEPVDIAELRRRIAAQRELFDWREGRTQRINSYFYTSQALELTRT